MNIYYTYVCIYNYFPAELSQPKIIIAYVYIYIYIYTIFIYNCAY